MNRYEFQVNSVINQNINNFWAYWKLSGLDSILPNNLTVLNRDIFDVGQSEFSSFKLNNQLNA